MAGLWDGVPASPCSGVSDDGRVRQTASSASHIYSPTRTRFSSRSAKPARPFSPGVAVGFKDASMSATQDTSELVTKLNINAADERRKMLLQKLRAIDVKKAALRRVASSPPPEQPSRAAYDPQISSIFEAATPEPAEVELVEPVSVQPADHAPSVSNLSNAKKRKKITKARPPTLSLDKLPAHGSALMDIEQFASVSSPAPTVTTCGSPMPSPSPPPHASVSYADLPSRTRSSRRVTRPRTPSVWLNGMPGDTVLSKLPVGVLKCKRYQFCKKLVSVMMKNTSAGPFCAPVAQLWPPESIPRYFDVITKPMDLGTVKKNLDGITYLDAMETNPMHMLKTEAFAEDVRQVFRNAMVYNNEGDMLYNCAEDLLEEFEVLWRRCPEPPPRSENRKKRQSSGPRSSVPGKRGRIAETSSSRVAKSNSGLLTPRKRSSTSTVAAKKTPRAIPKKTVSTSVKSRTSPMPSEKPLTLRQVKRKLEYFKKCRIALQARQPLPKGATFYDRAAQIHDVEMSFAEKSRLSEGIRRLQPAKLDTVLGILRDGSSGDDGHPDEIELDINLLDNVTLRNIEAFLEMVLPNYKTIRNSDVAVEYDCVEDFEDEEKQLLARVAEAKDRPHSSTALESSPKSSMDRESEELYASSDSDSDSESSDSDSSGSDSDSD